MKSVFNAEQFAKDIAFRRRKLRQSLRTAAEQIGISHATLSRIECGEKPDVDTLFRLCKWAGIENLHVPTYFKIEIP